MKTMNVGAIGGDYEDESLKRQIAMAQALRGKSLETPGEMVGGWYVGKNPLLNLGEAAIGHINERGAVDRQGELAQARQQAEQDWLARQPSAMMQQTKELMGPATDEGGALMGTADVPKPSQQLQQEVNQWGAQAPATSPLGQAVRAHALTQALSLPEKQMTAEQAAKDREHQLNLTLASKADEARRTEEFRAEQARLDRESRKELRQMPTIHINNTGGSAGNGFGGAAPVVGSDPADNTPIYRHTKSGKLFKYGADGMPTVYAGAVGAKPKPESAAAEKARHESNLGVVAIDDAIKEVEKHPAALGLKNVLPDVMRQRTDPGGVAARAAVANIGSLKLHDRSGAAVTAAEFPRLVPFIPNMKDSPAAAVVKLKKMKQEYQRMQAEWAAEKNTSGAGAGGGWKDL
jgi:hypothetical protein